MGTKPRTMVLAVTCTVWNAGIGKFTTLRAASAELIRTEYVVNLFDNGRMLHHVRANPVLSAPNVRQFTRAEGKVIITEDSVVVLAAIQVYVSNQPGHNLPGARVPRFAHPVDSTARRGI